MDEVGFIVKYSLFYLTLFFVVGLGAIDIFLTDSPTVIIPDPPTDVISAIGWFFANIGLFFSLMFIPAVDSSLQFVAIIFTVMTIGMIFIMVKLIIQLIEAIVPL